MEPDVVRARLIRCGETQGPRGVPGQIFVVNIVPVIGLLVAMGHLGRDDPRPGTGRHALGRLEADRHLFSGSDYCLAEHELHRWKHDLETRKREFVSVAGGRVVKTRLPFPHLFGSGDVDRALGLTLDVGIVHIVPIILFRTPVGDVGWHQADPRGFAKRARGLETHRNFGAGEKGLLVQPHLG